MIKALMLLTAYGAVCQYDVCLIKHVQSSESLSNHRTGQLILSIPEGLICSDTIQVSQPRTIFSSLKFFACLISYTSTSSCFLLRAIFSSGHHSNWYRIPGMLNANVGWLVRPVSVTLSVLSSDKSTSNLHVGKPSERSELPMLTLNGEGLHFVLMDVKLKAHM